jgi:RNA polymerase-binding transcription factor DksA
MATTETTRNERLKAMLMRQRLAFFSKNRLTEEHDEAAIEAAVGKLLPMERLRFRRLKDALGRHERGEYGMCPDCRKEISEDRVEECPFDNIYCDTCMSARHASKRSKVFR